MKMLQRLKPTIIKFALDNPQMAIKEIAEKFDCSDSWIKQEMVAAGCGRGYHVSANNKLAVKRKKALRLERELAQVRAEIVELAKAKT